MVPKGAFKPGSLGIYFEIDSKVDTSKPEFVFTEKYKGKIKTQKFKTPDGPFYSQGLLMAAEDFGWENTTTGQFAGDEPIIKIDDRTYLIEGDFLTERLGVVYAEDTDNKRKAKSADRYKLMTGKHPKVFRNPFIKWLYKRNWGKKLLFVFFGRGTKKQQFPAWVVKTDEERIQNLVSRIPEFRTEKWITTEKIDGTSTTFTMLAKDKKLIVCSRNVVMNQSGKEKTCYYADTDGNVYVEMAQKYDMNKVLKELLAMYSNVAFVTVQGETYGGSIQKRDYSTKEHDLAVFNVIIGYKDGTTKRLNPYEGKDLMDKFNIPYVPIIGKVEIPATCDEILTMAGGASAIDGLPREGLVFRTFDGVKSFKAVDNEFLTKYHG